MKYKGWTIVPTTEPWEVKMGNLFTYYPGDEPGEVIKTAPSLPEAMADIDERTENQ